jgi:tight adherence protein B
VAIAAPWLAERCGPASSPVAVLADLPPGVGARTAADLTVLARAWRVSEATGAAASHTTAAAAASVRARQEADRRVGAALAGPRASMRLLTLLPLAGPLVALLLGIDPGSLYGSVAARWAAATGLVLTAAGWRWTTALVGRAQRPADTAGRP